VHEKKKRRELKEESPMIEKKETRDKGIQPTLLQGLLKMKLSSGKVQI
jgi:hypothetical protein